MAVAEYEKITDEQLDRWLRRVAQDMNKELQPFIEQSRARVLKRLKARLKECRGEHPD